MEPRVIQPFVVLTGSRQDRDAPAADFRPAMAKIEHPSAQTVPEEAPEERQDVDSGPAEDSEAPEALEFSLEAEAADLRAAANA